MQFADTQPGHPEPDLALLSFISPNAPAITRWEQLLGDGHHIPVTAGSDAHENALPIMLADGERNVSSMCDELQLPQPTVSHHLGLLRLNNVIGNRRAGTVDRSTSGG